jgi:hypothetical protein
MNEKKAENLLTKKYKNKPVSSLAQTGINSIAL